MATKKKLLQAAAGTAAASGGAGALNVEDVFSTYLYEGNGSAQVIENGVNLGQSNSGGSGLFDPNVSTAMGVTLDGSNSGLDFGTGDFTFELFVYHTENSGAANNSSWDIYYSQNQSSGSFWFGREASSNVIKYKSVSQINGTSSIPLNEWAHIAVVRYNGVTKSYLNGNEQTSDSNSYTLDVNTGSNPFIGNYYGGGYGTNGRISNFRIVKGTAVYTSNNFTVPTSPLTDISGTVFLGFQDEGPFVDNSSNAITVSDNGYGGVTASSFGPFDAADAGEGGLVWAKQRTGTSSQHALFDTENGTLKALASSSTAALATEASVTSFNANGFSLGNFNNTSGQDYVSWTFRKAPKFFDVVTYTGTGSAQNISHNLGSVPAVVIVKRTSSAEDWLVYHRSTGNQAGTGLNETAATYTGVSAYWNSTTPTDSVFTVGTHARVNTSGETYVAYLFAHNDGDGDFGPTGDQDVIRCGSYTGNGSTTGPVIDLGFEPQWLLIKRASGGTGNWFLVDTTRGLPVGGYSSALFPNTSGAEDTAGAIIDVLPTGFQPRQASIYINASSSDYIYIAIRRGPMAVPTAATDVFDIATRDATHPSFDASFDTVDFSFVKNSASTGSWRSFSRLQGQNYMSFDLTNAEALYTSAELDHMDGWSYGVGTSSTFYSWMWKRAPNYFDVVAYTGNGTAGRTVSHNLGVAPEMMWVKRRNANSNWSVYHSAIGNDKYIVLNTTNTPVTSSAFWNNTDPTASSFTVGTSNGTNNTNDTYIAYLFASLDGVSKVGTFTGNGSTLNVDCGFSSGARFVIIKRDSGPWRVFDTERGIVAGNDPFLNLNNTDAEVTSVDLLDPYSSGFTVNYSSDYGFNTNGDTFYFYAIAT